MNTSDQLLVAASLLVVGIVTVGLSLPLIYRKVPMNRFYGIRIPQAFASTERWYAINAHGGRLLASWSCLITATGLAGFVIPLRLLPAYAIAAACVVLISVVVPLVQIIRWAKATDKM